LEAKSKIGYQKINDLRVSTFLFSVICDRAVLPRNQAKKLIDLCWKIESSPAVSALARAAALG
jgi:NADH:ubiquinone oxidoreductase subunit H